MKLTVHADNGTIQQEYLCDAYDLTLLEATGRATRVYGGSAVLLAGVLPLRHAPPEFRSRLRWIPVLRHRVKELVLGWQSPASTFWGGRVGYVQDPEAYCLFHWDITWQGQQTCAFTVLGIRFVLGRTPLRFHGETK